MAVLRYWDVFDGAERMLYRPLSTTRRDGTEPQSIVALAKRFGLAAEYKDGVTFEDLIGALEAKQTVIVDLQAWTDEENPSDEFWKNDKDDGHYVVLVGHSPAEPPTFFFMDPSAPGNYAFLREAELSSRWRDTVGRGKKEKVVDRMAIFISGNEDLRRATRPTTHMG